MNDVTRRLKECFDESGMSYGELSEKTGIAKSVLQRYVTGRTEKIPLTRMKTIAQALGVPATYIMGWSEKPIESKREEHKAQETTLTDRDLDAIAQRVVSFQSPNSEAPRTVEARIVSFAMDQLPQEERERLLAMFRAMYSNHPELFKREEKQ